MIIGSGLIANAFAPSFSDDPDIIIFASGVSNSQENRVEAFLREKQLLLECLSLKKKIFYFSTCSVHDPQLLDKPYAVHKIEMENLVAASPDYVIFRLPQVVGTTPNPNTLTNYLHKQILSGSHFQIWRHAKRNLIDVDDVALIATHLHQTFNTNRQLVNIACPFSLTIDQIVSIFELVLGIKANYSLVDMGGDYQIDSGLASEVAQRIGVSFDDTYIEKLIRKYYGK